MKRLKNKYIALLIFIIVSILFLFPIFKGFGNWGFHDWDQHLFYNAVPRKTILQFKQFPLWNPYYCGGNAMLANPQSAFLSPLYLLVLLFGVVHGIKLEIIAHFIIGLYGMFLLSKYFKLGIVSSYLPPVVYVFGSWFTLRILAGHTIYLTMAFIPYVFLFYLKAIKQFKFIFISSLFSALIVFGGGTYPFYFVILLLTIHSILLVLKGLLDKKGYKAFRPLVILFSVLILAILLSAVKSIPSFTFLSKSYEGTEDIQYNSLKIFFNSIISRTQEPWKMEKEFGLSHDESDENYLVNRVTGKVPWAWHEYGAYVGLVPLLLFVFSFKYYKRLWSLQVTAIIFLILTLGEILPYNPWNLIRILPYLNNLHGPSRFIMPFMFLLAIISGCTLSRCEKKNFNFKGVNLSMLIPLFVIIFVFLDLLLVNYPIISRVFSKDAVKVESSLYPNFIQIISSDKYVSQYPNFLQNLGTANCYERVHPPIKVTPQFFDDGGAVKEFMGDAYFPDLNKTADMVYFSPNKIKVAVDIDKTSILVINQNYHPGWKIKGGEVFSYNGLIATNVTKGDKLLELYYLPSSFIIGLIISILTFIVCVYGFVYAQKRQNSNLQVGDTPFLASHHI